MAHIETFTPLSTRGRPARRVHRRPAAVTSPASSRRSTDRPDLRAFCDLPLRLHPARPVRAASPIAGDRGARPATGASCYLVRDGAGDGRRPHVRAPQRRGSTPSSAAPPAVRPHRVRRRRRRVRRARSTSIAEPGRDADALFGPVALLPNQTGGVITSGFAERGFVDSAWNPAYYPQAYERHGFTRRFEADTWIVRRPDGDPDAGFPLRRRADRGRAAGRPARVPPRGFAATAADPAGDAQRELRAARLLHRDLRRRARRADRRAGVPARRGAAAVAGEGRPPGRVRRHRARHLGVPHARRRPARPGQPAAAARHPPPLPARRRARHQGHRPGRAGPGLPDAAVPGAAPRPARRRVPDACAAPSSSGTTRPRRRSTGGSAAGRCTATRSTSGRR